MRRLLICLVFLLSLFAARATGDTLEIPLPGGQKLPPHTRILYFGDSQTSFSYKSTDNSVQYQNYGYAGWVATMSPGVQLPKGGILAVPGETTSQMVNRLDELRPFNAKILVVLAGTNDPLYAIPPETTKANLRRVYDAGIALGMKVIAITILPRFAQNTYSPPVEANRLAINEWIKSQTDIIPLDVEADLNGAEYFEDGLHTSPLGAFALAKRVSAVVNHLVAQCTVGSGSVEQLSVSPNSNPLMTGSNGRLSNPSGFVNTSGTVASNWQLAGNFASTATVVGSKETDANGREQQVITISGNYTGKTSRVTFNNYVSSPITLNSGDVVEGLAEIEIPQAMTGIRSVYLKLQGYSTNYATTLAEAYSMFPTSGKPLNIPPGKYLLRTPPMTIGPGGPVWQLTTQIYIEFNSTTTTDPVSAVIKVNSVGVRQLPLSDGPSALIFPSGTQPYCPGDDLQLSAGAGSNISYQWFRNGSALADSTAQKLWVSETGQYTVAVKAPGCEVVSQPVIVEAGDCPTYGVTVDSLPSQLCTGQTFSIPYRVSDAFAEGNRFEAQLSNREGLFDEPVVIGTLNATGDSTIVATLPANLVADSSYRIRIVASQPSSISLVAQTIRVNTKPVVSIHPSDTTDAWPNLPAVMKASPAGDYSYQWLLNGQVVDQYGTDSTFTTIQPGDYRVAVTSASGCTDTSAITVVRLNPCNQLSVFLSTTDSTISIDSVLGGIAPYTFSLDSVQFQTAAAFSNLTPGHTYTVFVKDSVNCTGKTTVTLPVPVITLATQIPENLCAGQALPVDYIVSDSLGEANRFYLQLSNAEGSFDFPFLLDSVLSRTGGQLTGHIPDTVQPGSQYRLRIVSSQPVLVSDSSRLMAIGARPSAVIQPADTAYAYPNFPATLTASPAGSYTYQWLLNNEPVADNGNNATFTTVTEGAYRVIVSSGSCADTSAAVVVKLNDCAEFSIAVNSQDSSVYIVNVSGGLPPYQYSLDSLQYQAEPMFTGLVPGQDYTIYVRDSVNCVGKLAFTVRDPVDFEPQKGTGGKGTSFTPQKLGKNPGIVVVTYDMQTVPDKMDINYNGETVVSTPGYVTDKGWLWFNYSPLPDGPYYCNVRLLAEQGGAEWTYRALMPVSQYMEMQNGADSTNATVFVSPNFPNSYPANSRSVFTFTPESSGGRLRADFKALLLHPADVLTVYNGPSTSDSVLGQFSGAHNILQTPVLVAANPTGQLTFEFVSGDSAGRYGWIADVHTVTSIGSFYPQKAAAGDTITILGNGFSRASAVRFGGVGAKTFEVISDTLIRAVVDSGATGSVEVVSPGGQASLEGFEFNNETLLCPVGVYTLTAGGTGTSYQWQVSTDSVNFVDLADTDLYSGTSSSSLQLTNLPTSANGYQYRCVVSGVASRVFTVRFVNTWTGGTDTNWETPSNWSCGVVPDEYTDVVIRTGVVTMNASTSVRTLTLKTGSHLTLGENVVLQVKK